MITWLVWILLSGYLLLKLILNKREEMQLKDIFIIPGLGFVVSAQVVFYCLMIFQEVLSMGIVLAHLLVLILLLVAVREHRLPNSFFYHLNGVEKILLILFIPFIIFLIIMTISHPYGQWDAWSFWNFRANYLFRAGHDWSHLFKYGFQAGHPWFLPFIVVGGWSFIGVETFWVPILIAIIFSLATVALLVSSLNEHIPTKFAIIAGLFLISVPAYVIFSTNQYADIIMAYAVLGFAVYYVPSKKQRCMPDACLLVACLVMMAFCKDNGIVTGIGLGLATFFKYFPKREHRPLLIRLLYVFMLFCLPIIVSRWWSALSCVNHAYEAQWAQLLIFDRWRTLILFIGDRMLNEVWGGTLWIIGVIFLMRNRQVFNRENRILWLFLGLYLISYSTMFIASTSDLKWLLNVSYDRMIITMLPLIVYLTFQGFRERHDQ